MPIVAATDFTFPSQEIEKRIVQNVSECWRHLTQLLDAFSWSADLTTITPYLMAPNPAHVAIEIKRIGSLTNPVIAEGESA